MASLLATIVAVDTLDSGGCVVCHGGYFTLAAALMGVCLNSPAEVFTMVGSFRERRLLVLSLTTHPL
jgi:hypothetical protein